MPRFDLRLNAVVKTSTAIASAGELSHICSDPKAKAEWTISRLESLYEIAFLRVFAAWEICLESIFYRSLCGYAFSAGQEITKSGSYYPSLADAESKVMAFLKGSKATYLLWHNPADVINRCQQFITPALAIQERTLSSNLSRLQYMAATRHRVVHDNRDSQNKFDNATLGIAGRTYPASRPGKFLRDIDPSSPVREKWLETLTRELVALSKQMT